MPNTNSTEAHQVAIDTGGTFTDVAVRRPDGSIFVWKVSSTPSAPDDAVMDGLLGALNELGISADLVNRFVHGTTVATNTVITRTGGRVGLVTTQGFGDLLDIGFQTRPSLYDQTQRRSAPLVPEAWVWETPGRTSSEGIELEPLDRGRLQEIAEEIRESALDVVVVSLMNAYVNPEAENQVVSFLQDAGVAPSVFAATAISPEIREYERTSTAVINGYVQPKIAGYIDRLEKRVSEASVPTRMWVMQSNGGLLSPETAQHESARTVLSGLAGGVVGAAGWARLLELPSVVSFDIGGTSTDIALIRNGQPDEVVSGEIEGFPMRMPTVDVHTIGAGGGSIAWRDTGGGLRVGPQSAGAVPGPVCYSRGGTEVTVTDAHAVLGRLGQTLLGGRLTLDVEAARSKVTEFAGEVGLTPEQTAEGIIKVINANMARGVRKVSVERGIDLRDCNLMAFGGAGPLHGCDLVKELGMRSAVIPPMPGIASAVGMLDAPIRHDFSSSTMVASQSEMLELESAFLQLEAKVAATSAQSGDATLQLRRLVDARYVGQSYELTIPFSTDFESVREHFDSAHAERYGFDDPEAIMEIVTARIVATADQQAPTTPAQSGMVPADTVAKLRQVYFDGQWMDTQILERSALQADSILSGPLVIEQFDSTIIVNPSQNCRTDTHGFLHIYDKDNR